MGLEDSLGLGMHPTSLLTALANLPFRWSWWQHLPTEASALAHMTLSKLFNTLLGMGSFIIKVWVSFS